MNIEFPAKAVPVLFGQGRYKVLHGGRGGSKSWNFARYLILKTAWKRYRVLCTREMQNSIRDSVYRLLVDQIHLLGLDSLFIIKADTILGVFGSEFIFKGLHHNISEIKSLEGVDICWVEEAEKVSAESWEILIPTIRQESSEILVSFNPEEEKSATYERFIAKNGVAGKPDGCLIAELNYYDNPWFPEVLRREMEYDKRTDPEKYQYVWEGKPKRYAQALIFKNVKIEAFETPVGSEFKFGADFGFSQDPACLVRMFIKDRCLFIDYEAYGVGVEIDELEAFFKSVPEAFKSRSGFQWKITADSQRPDTISYLANKGFNIVGAEKGKGSVEDGIAFLRGFEHIIIHPRCRGAVDNFSNYKWKEDRITREVLPIPLDASNHVPDACRYALEDYIKGNVTIFDVLGG